jgi:hypothetical protein
MDCHSRWYGKTYRQTAVVDHARQWKSTFRAFPLHTLMEQGQADRGQASTTTKARLSDQNWAYASKLRGCAGQANGPAAQHKIGCTAAILGDVISGSRATGKSARSLGTAPWVIRVRLFAAAIANAVCSASAAPSSPALASEPVQIHDECNRHGDPIREC